MPSADARPRTPSISELQAALLAVRNGEFATGHAVPAWLTTGPPAEPALGQHFDVDDALKGPMTSVLSPPHPAATTGRPPAGDGIWLLGTHGGSGARCLTTVLAGTRLAGRQWPMPTAAREQVVLVCRSSQRGLSTAQDPCTAFS